MRRRFVHLLLYARPCYSTIRNCQLTRAGVGKGARRAERQPPPSRHTHQGRGSARDIRGLIITNTSNLEIDAGDYLGGEDTAALAAVAGVPGVPMTPTRSPTGAPVIFAALPSDLRGNSAAFSVLLAELRDATLYCKDAAGRRTVEELHIASIVWTRCAKRARASCRFV